jgi:putative oxidoreductase
MSPIAISIGQKRVPMNTDDLQTVWAPRALAILRIVAALIFMEHGTQKLLGFPPSDNPGPALFSLFGLAGVLEVVGGILLLLGLFTRPVAFILSGQMAVAYWMAHAPQSFFPALNGGDAAILYCFVFLYLAVAGAGAWSLDNAMRSQS